MLSIQTILHPTDFSEHSQAAFRLACALARNHSARLVLLHAEQRPTIAPLMGAIPADPECSCEEQLARLTQLQREAAGVQTEALYVICNDPAAEILRTAQELPCQLIVMGTHGRTGLSRALMGSVAEQVTRRATCPVLTIKMPLNQAPLASDPAPKVIRRASGVILF